MLWLIGSVKEKKLHCCTVSNVLEQKRASLNVEQMKLVDVQHIKMLQLYAQVNIHASAHDSYITCIVSTLIIALASEFGNCTTGDVQLVDGPSPNKGRVEVCINQAWASVCNRNFHSEEANVVCGQLGYSTIGKKHFLNCFYHLEIFQSACCMIRCTSKRSKLLWPRIWSSG